MLQQEVEDVQTNQRGTPRSHCGQLLWRLLECRAKLLNMLHNRKDRTRSSLEGEVVEVQEGEEEDEGMSLRLTCMVGSLVANSLRQMVQRMASQISVQHHRPILPEMLQLSNQDSH